MNWNSRELNMIVSIFQQLNLVDILVMMSVSLVFGVFDLLDCQDNLVDVLIVSFIIDDVVILLEFVLQLYYYYLVFFL